MFNVTRLIHADEAHHDRLIAELRDAAVGRSAVIAATAPGSRNGGDILTHLRFDSESDWESAECAFSAIFDDPAITHIDGVDYRGMPTRCAGDAGSVYRTLLLRVLPGTENSTVARFEADLRMLTRYVSSITAWQLSRVETAIGTSPWTHVFEQEFTDAAGLMGPYLMHPIHWAHVDRWFDPECPDVIIRDRVCHSFCPIAEPVLT
jgi:hypothetical protein